MEKSNDRVLSVIKSRSDKREFEGNKRLLKETQDFYHILFEESHDPIYILDINGRFIDVNPAFLDLFGYSNNEIKELTLLDFYVDPRVRIGLVNEIRRNEFVKDYEVKLRKSDGKIIDTLITANVRTSPDGIMLGFQGIIHDVTDRKVAETTAKNFKWTLDNTLDSVFMFDTVTLQFTYVNKGAMDQVGYTEEELFKMSPLDIKPEYNEESFRKILKQLMDATKKSLTFETVHKRKDGELIPVEVFLQHSAPPCGKPQFIAIVRDISNRKERDEVVRKLSYAIDQSANSVVITDTGGNIEYVNPKFEKVTGYTFDEIKGKNPRILKSGETSPEEYENLWKTISSGKVWRGEFHNKRKNGDLYWERASISPIKNESGVITHYLGIKEDITESKRITEELNKKHLLVLEANTELKKAFAKEEKLRSALMNAEKLASLGEMASKIAHEINNPLTVIKAQAEIRAQMVTDEALKESLLMIKTKADQIRDLTRGYMNLAKPEETELTKIKLRDVLKATVTTLLPLGQLKHIRISEEYMKDEPSIFGDPGRLEQVFRNLIINAVDATTEKSSSEIKIGTKLSEDGKSVDAYVKDNGVGIEAEDIKKIFEPYYTKKERAAGTGLGLVIVKETTENVHGGKLKVESSPGVGTEFHVIIPSEKYSQLKKRLLIVDDDVSISELLAQYFIHKGLSVNTAENGKIALDRLDDFKPDLILSDIEMPELDGLGLVDEVRKMNPKQRFVMMTGFDDRAKASEPLNKIDIPLIMKPPDLEDELWPIIKEKLEIA